ncbi:MAG TPA: DUF5818 domain-containing protein [Terriglobales bacterium]
MRKLSLLAAVLLLSSAWVLAQNSTPPAPDTQNPSSTSPSAQQPAQQPDTSQTASGDHAGQSVEGCIGGSAGNFTLTDASGKTYQLAGDTSKLGDHVGHEVRVTGDEAAASGSAAAAGGPTTLTVKKVKMISSSCPNK